MGRFGRVAFELLLLLLLLLFLFLLLLLVVVFLFLVSCWVPGGAKVDYCGDWTRSTNRWFLFACV